MHDDEAQNRQLLATWMEATKAGDSETVLSLVTDDVVFLLPGQVMRHSDFEKAIRAQSSGAGPKIDGRSEIQEIQVAGDWAFMWTKLRVTVMPPQGSEMVRSGHTLTVLRRQDGCWRIARDANLLVPE